MFRSYLSMSAWQYGRLFFVITVLILAACQNVSTETIVVTRVVVVEGEENVITQLVRQETTPIPAAANVFTPKPVTLDISYLGEQPNFDPQITIDENGIDLIENMFVGLTNYNQADNVVEPELAQSWEVSANGRNWTFRLREDVFWVMPSQSEIGKNEINQAIAIRPVTADDMVFAIQRACRRDTKTPDAFILFLIEGCEQVYSNNDPTPADLNAIGIRALDEFTLQISLIKPASHFLAITSMWLFHPVPRELVEEFKDDWQTAVPLMTSGPYIPVSSLESSSQLVLHRNTLWPIVNRGNVDVINILYFDEPLPAYQLWQAKSLDTSPIPSDPALEAVIEQLTSKIQFSPEQTVFYLGFNFDSGVFREPLVRRAFAAAIDRERLVEEMFEGQALGMRHLTPPGVNAGPPIDRIGVGYSPDDARQWLAESGFRSCRLMPPITFLVTTSDASLRQAELIRDMWIGELGCAQEQIIIEQVQFGTLLANTRRDAGADRPDVWELAWASYYPDAQNWLGDLLHCTDGGNRQNRPCSEVDGMIRQAVGTVNPQERIMLYREIEDIFFGGLGIMPLIPLYVRGDELLVQSWLNYPPALFGGEQFDTYVIDMEQKELERSR